MKWLDTPAEIPGSYYERGQLSSDGIAKALTSLAKRIDDLEAQIAQAKKRK